MLLTWFTVFYSFKQYYSYGTSQKTKNNHTSCLWKPGNKVWAPTQPAFCHSATIGHYNDFRMDEGGIEPGRSNGRNQVDFKRQKKRMKISSTKCCLCEPQSSEFRVQQIYINIASSLEIATAVNRTSIRWLTKLHLCYLCPAICTAQTREGKR